MLPMLAVSNITIEKIPATAKRWLLSIGGMKDNSPVPILEFLMRSGSAAKAKKGKIDVTPSN
jgi:hypothetical protein